MVSCFSAFRSVRSGATPAERLGACLNLARACEAAQRPTEAYGFLNRASRLLGENQHILADQLQASKAKLPTHHPHLPSGWTVVHAWEDPQSFNALVGHEGPLFCSYVHPGAALGGILGRPGFSSNDAAYGLQNASFHILVDGQHAATVPLVATALNVLGGANNHPAMGNVPAEICYLDPRLKTPESTRHIVSHVYHVARAFCVDQILLGEPLKEALHIAPSFGPQLRYSTELWSIPVVDLSLGSDEIFKHLRKSYKSQVNWGKRALKSEYLSGAQLTDEKIVEVHGTLQALNSEVHSRYGNGMTRELFLFPILSCLRGEGEVAIARDEQGQAVGMTVTTDLNGVSYYALGGYTKSGNTSAGHYMLFDAIERSRARGNARYALNRYFPAPESPYQSADQRNRNIRFFKSGFTNQFQYLISYLILADSIPLEL